MSVLKDNIIVVGVVITLSLMSYSIYQHYRVDCDDSEISCLVDKADTGDVEAMSDLGWMYEEGKGQPGSKPDFKEAIKWYTKAADAGNTEGMYNLGVMYYEGKGQPGNKPNFKEAIKWYKKAADVGYVDAMYNLGWMNEEGIGRPGNKPNFKEAIKWYTKAADAGDKEAKGKVVEIQKLIPSDKPPKEVSVSDVVLESTAKVACKCENNKVISLYFDADEKDEIIETYKVSDNEIIEEDGEYFIKSKFTYWNDEEEMLVYPKKFCQIPSKTKMKDNSYADGGERGYEGYYDNELYYWDEGLKKGHMYAACDE